MLPTAISALLTAGFFQDKAADAKARGEKLPPKKDPKQEYEAFLKDIAADVQEADKREQEDAAEAATERAEREQHEQRWAVVRQALVTCEFP